MDMVKSKEKLNILYFGLMLYICMSMMGLSMHILGFGIFIISVFLSIPRSELGKIRVDGYIKTQLCFLGFVVLSLIWTDRERLEFNTTVSILLGIIEAVFFSIWFKGFLSRNNDVEGILKALITSSIAAAFYAIVNTPLYKWTSISNFFLGDYGLNNHNTLGMFAAMCSALCFYFIMKKAGVRYYILLAAELIIVVLSGSRKGFFLAAFCIAAVYVLSERNIKFIRNIILVLILMIVAYLFLIYNETLYNIAGKKLQVLITNIFIDNNATDGSIEERRYFITQAMYLFSQHPLIGVGINGFRSYMDQIGYYHVTYSHCNYTELLSNYGIIGFLLYYLLKVKVIVKGMSTIRKNNLFSLLSWIFLLALAITEYGAVSYYSVWMQLFWTITYYVVTKQEVSEDSLKISYNNLKAFKNKELL